MLNIRRISGPLLEPVALAQVKQHLRISQSMTDDDQLISAYITAAREVAEKTTGRAFFPQTWELSLDHFPWWNYSSGTIPAGVRENWPFWSAYLDVLAIKLPWPRALSVNSITYLDNTGNPQTLAASSYSLDADAEPGRVYPLVNQSWPTQQAVLPGAVKVNYTAGAYCTTQTETLGVPATGALTVPLSQAAQYLGMVSVMTTGATPVAIPQGSGGYTIANGVLTLASAYAGQQIAVSYYVPQCPQAICIAIMLLVAHWYQNREAVSDLQLAKLPLGVDSLLAAYTHYTFSC